MADSAGLLVLVATCVVMLVVPPVQAARANDRDLARLKDHVVLRRAHQAGTLGMPLQQAVDQLAAGRSVTKRRSGFEQDRPGSTLILSSRTRLGALMQFSESNGRSPMC
jgi:N-acyl-D-aspartate/D-glutamate deacylase